MSEIDQGKIDQLQNLGQQNAVAIATLTAQGKATDEKFNMMIDTVKELSKTVKESTDKINGTSGLKDEITELKIAQKELTAEVGKHRHDVAQMMNSHGPLLLEHTNKIASIDKTVAAHEKSITLLEPEVKKNTEELAAQNIRLTAVEKALNMAQGGAVVVEKGGKAVWAVVIFVGTPIIGALGYFIGKYLNGVN